MTGPSSGDIVLKRGGKEILRFHEKIDDATVEETDHRQGKVVDEIRLALAKDGNTITVVDKDIAHGQTITYTLGKLP